VMGRLALIEHFEVRIREEQQQLDFMTINSTWFRTGQTTESGEKVDTTEQSKDLIRRHITDYRRAIDYLESLPK
jgi:hypothetical protein